MKNKHKAAKRSRNTKGRLQKGPVTAASASGVATAAPNFAPTTPFSLFSCCIMRARNLVTLCGGSGASRSQSCKDDACRAAIVLAISALDAYLRTFVLNKVVLKVGDPGHRMSDKLKTQIHELIDYEKILDAARQGDLRSRIETAFRSSFEEQSFQGVHKITESLKMIGYDNVFDIIARSAGINEQNLKRDISTFTQRRHTIAHCGDHDLSQTPPIENPISARDANKCIDTVVLIATEIDKLS